MALDLSTMTLSVTDTLLGTSAVASVSNAGAGSAVSFFRAPWNHAAGGAMDWTEVASGTANGLGNLSATISTPPGFYVWLAARMATGTAADRLTRAVYRPVVDLNDPIHLRILDSVVAGIRSLNLDGIGADPAKVFRRWFPIFLHDADTATGGGAGLPQVQVAPYSKETPLDVMSNRDDVGYPVMVAFFDNVNPTLDSNMGRNLKWRRQVGAMFRAQQLAGSPEVVLTTWTPEAISNVPALQQNYHAGGIVFTFRSREDRGVVA